MHDRIDILLVDDERRNLDALESILDDGSYRLLRAESADAALKLLLEHDVAAIVLDIKMPGVSGFELAHLIKGTKKFRHIPIVFLTAYLIEDEDVLAGYGAGAVDYLTKPVNPMILRHKVAVFADLFRKTRALAELNEKLEARVQERTAQLERANQALEHANRMKDEFLATVSHELRTPLHAMLGWAAILKQSRGNQDKIDRGLEVIERNAKAQERLVTDLLDVSRIVSGKLRLTMSPFPLANAIRAAADVVRPAADSKGVHLVLDLDPDVGAVVGDAGRLQQVVWNLLVNAIRYTPPAGAVTLTAKRDGSRSIIRVDDTGVGIPPEHLPHVFERFRQVDSSTTRAHGGLGLGLALVRHLVEAHGGTVTAASEGAGRGSTFTVCLPIRSTEGSEAAATGEPANPPSGWRVELAGVRVLVVEDDCDSRELVRVVLEAAGACVTVAENATEALNALDDGSFDAIVSDIGMPGVDGYVFMSRVRSGDRGETIPSIALTAYAGGEDVEKAKRAGYHLHLAKPVDPGKLVEAVRTLVRTTEGPGRSGAGLRSIA